MINPIDEREDLWPETVIIESRPLGDFGDFTQQPPQIFLPRLEQDPSSPGHVYDRRDVRTPQKMCIVDDHVAFYFRDVGFYIYPVGSEDLRSVFQQLIQLKVLTEERFEVLNRKGQLSFEESDDVAGAIAPGEEG